MPRTDQEQARSDDGALPLHWQPLPGATVSVGIAQLEVGDDIEILREKADSTLYAAKHRGRNTVCTFSGENADQKIVTQAKIRRPRTGSQATHRHRLPARSQRWSSLNRRL